MRPEFQTEVCAYTTTYMVHGFVSLVPGARLTDWLRESGEFIAITDAEVWRLDGSPVLRTKFLDINRDHLEMIMPMDSMTDTSKMS